MAASQGDHAVVTAGTLVQSRYMIMKEIGCGNFSKVYTCKDTKHAQYTAANPDASPTYALKILKREYANDAAFERDMLKVLGNKDPHQQADVSKMLDVFHWNRYPCFLMPLQGPTLRSKKLGISKGHVTRHDMVRLTRSLLKTLKFIHFDCKMVHTDLKPENILVNKARSNDLTEQHHVAAPGSVPSSSSTSCSSGFGEGWTICDFGSASHWRTDKMDSDLISTRPYRAPEVVLGNPWTYSADVWSLGCILYEAAAGSRLFEVHDDNTHLHLMTSRLGALPEHYTRNSKHSKKFFDTRGSFLRPGTGPVLSNPTATKPIRSVLTDEPLLVDLLHCMLHYDPTKRIRADEALDHPYLTTTASTPATNTPADSSCGSTVVPSQPSSTLTTPRDQSTPPPVKAAAPVQAAATKTAATGSSAAVARSGSSSSRPTSGTTSSILATRSRPSLNTNAAASGFVNKYRALPPLLSAFQALGLEGGPLVAKENVTSPTHNTAAAIAAAQRPVQGSCRTPEELRRAPLSANVGGGSRLFPGGKHAAITKSAIPRSASSNSIITAAGTRSSSAGTAVPPFQVAAGKPTVVAVRSGYGR